MITYTSALSRRAFFGYSAATVVLATLGIGATNYPALAAPGSTPPRPQNALQALFNAMDKYPLIGLGEAHRLQEEHDFIQALLYHPALPGKINDIVVEFGNARYQEIIDRFISGQPVANTDLRQIWRNTTITGANPVWDAPVYEQFFRSVRAVNMMLPPSQRLRVLLGDPPIDWDKVQRKEDWVAYALQRDTHFAGVVEREVLQKGRRALLIAGTNHLLHNIRGEGDPDQPPDKAPFNAATQIEQRHPHSLFSIDILIILPEDTSAQARQIATWNRPAMITLAGTWLGAETIPSNTGAAATTRAALADAMLYLGQAGDLTASRPDPSLYQSGEYAAELERRGKMLVAWGIQQGDPLEVALKQAELGPGYFSS
ncbi:MAG TPA: hypothetical protein VKV37_13945 [Ktedonobacteraceae bacterium]|nr:hypothetical protein [Ktedonobacteraceae bacterium]